MRNKSVHSSVRVAGSTSGLACCVADPPLLGEADRRVTQGCPQLEGAWLVDQREQDFSSVTVRLCAVPRRCRTVTWWYLWILIT